MYYLRDIQIIILHSAMYHVHTNNTIEKKKSAMSKQ